VPYGKRDLLYTQKRPTNTGISEVRRDSAQVSKETYESVKRGHKQSVKRGNKQAWAYLSGSFKRDLLGKETYYKANETYYKAKETY